MKIKITYRTGSNPVIIQSEEKTIAGIASDCAKQLTKKHMQWRISQGNPMNTKAAKRYEIGQKYMILQKLER